MGAAIEIEAALFLNSRLTLEGLRDAAYGHEQRHVMNIWQEVARLVKEADQKARKVQYDNKAEAEAAARDNWNALDKKLSEIAVRNMRHLFPEPAAGKDYPPVGTRPKFPVRRSSWTGTGEPKSKWPARGG